MRPLINKGFENEPIFWELISQSTSNGKVKSVYEYQSRVYDKIYHLVDISGYEIAVEQHLSCR